MSPNSRIAGVSLVVCMQGKVGRRGGEEQNLIYTGKVIGSRASLHTGLYAYLHAV